MKLALTLLAEPSSILYNIIVPAHTFWQDVGNDPYLAKRNKIS